MTKVCWSLYSLPPPPCLRLPAKKMEHNNIKGNKAMCAVLFFSIFCSTVAFCISERGCVVVDGHMETSFFAIVADCNCYGGVGGFHKTADFTNKNFFFRTSSLIYLVQAISSAGAQERG